MAALGCGCSSTPNEPQWPEPTRDAATDSATESMVDSGASRDSSSPRDGGATDESVSSDAADQVHGRVVDVNTGRALAGRTVWIGTKSTRPTKMASLPRRSQSPPIADFNANSSRVSPSRDGLTAAARWGEQQGEC